MKHSNKLLITTMACLVAAAPLAQATDHAIEQNSNASKSEVVGVGTGLAVGAAVGGPVGAIIGAAIGAHYGDTYHQAKTQEELAQDTLKELDASRTQVRNSIDQQERLDNELQFAQNELNELTQKINELFVERALVDGLQFDVHFDTNEADLGEADRDRLVRLSQLLQAVPEAEVSLHGFADARGNDVHNETLALDRAYTVADTLNALGVAQAQLRTYGYGESKATYTGDKIDRYSHDRRVSIQLRLPVDEILESDPADAQAAIDNESQSSKGGN